MLKSGILIFKNFSHLNKGFLSPVCTFGSKRNDHFCWHLSNMSHVSLDPDRTVWCHVLTERGLAVVRCIMKGQSQSSEAPESLGTSLSENSPVLEGWRIYKSVCPYKCQTIFFSWDSIKQSRISHYLFLNKCYQNIIK